ncbi:unnamed protein product [Arctia plantaginis]|uniref:CLIP domain-containing serine protease n=1 Tax=Arctia plantaginis TaxID=874455 RepID=A0A8S1A7M1_ARCPL|nr:unnamed protein product [Arctia plantaginis]
MNSCTILSVLFAVFCVVNAQQGPCTTASGGQGECKSIYNCPSLLAVVNKPNRTPQDMDLLKRSHCGFDGQAPAVCCPGDNEPPKPSNQCFTPEGKPGQCVTLYSCPDIANLLKPPVPNDKIIFVQQSKCNGPDQYSVCCGPVPDFQNVQKGNCASKVTAFPPDPRTECCGLDGSTKNKIVGGSPATVDAYPWLVLIEYVKDGVVKTLCGGALISGKYVLTAGHCVAGPVLTRGTPANIRLGEYDTGHEGPDCMITEEGGEDCSQGVTRIPIDRTIPHPQYNPAHPQKRNDIGLIRMAQMAPYTEFIRPICLPTLDVTQGTGTFNTTVAGWGAVSTKQSSSAVKLHVELPFVSKAVCQPAYAVPGRSIPLWKGQFCAGGEKGKDSCKGDSGGPLMYENGRIYEAIGVVSFGPIPCGLENIPGVYTNVFEYITWIRNTIVP